MLMNSPKVNEFHFNETTQKTKTRRKTLQRCALTFFASIDTKDMTKETKKREERDKETQNKPKKQTKGHYFKIMTQTTILVYFVTVNEFLF